LYSFDKSAAQAGRNLRIQVRESASFYYLRPNFKAA
jgi:hypothetical protein